MVGSAGNAEAVGAARSPSGHRHAYRSAEKLVVVLAGEINSGLVERFGHVVVDVGISETECVEL